MVWSDASIASLQEVIQRGDGIDNLRPRKRPDKVADQIKRWIMRDQIQPGEKLPQERELIELFGVSKGTIREALKSLEVQGLVRIRTGPGGGATVVDVSFETATELLGNYFYSKDVSLRHLYELHKLLSPDLAFRVCGQLTESDFRALDRSISARESPPRSPQESRRHGMAAIDFHDVLADACPNPVLGFQCRWINTMLKTLPVARRIHERPGCDMITHGVVYHQELVRAFRNGNAAMARALMANHIDEAEQFMLELEMIQERRFAREDGL